MVVGRTTLWTAQRRGGRRPGERAESGASGSGPGVGSGDGGKGEGPGGGPGGVAGSVRLDKKVNFPLTGLDLNPYLSGPLQQGGELFDLYGSVCHYGSTLSGQLDSISSKASHNMLSAEFSFSAAMLMMRHFFFIMVNLEHK